MEYFAKEDDVRSRIGSGYLRYKGEWCSVRQTEGWKVEVESIEQKGPKRYWFDVRKDMDDVDISRPRIGFFNYSNAYWGTVIPQRQYHQLLTPRAVHLELLGGPNGSYHLGMLSDEEVSKALRGIYPDLKEAFSLLKEHGQLSVAISRTLALALKLDKKKNEKTVHLYHMMNHVGVYNDLTEKFDVEATFYSNHAHSLLKKYKVPV